MSMTKCGQGPPRMSAQRTQHGANGLRKTSHSCNASWPTSSPQKLVPCRSAATVNTCNQRHRVQILQLPCGLPRNGMPQSGFSRSSQMSMGLQHQTLTHSKHSCMQVRRMHHRQLQSRYACTAVKTSPVWMRAKLSRSVLVCSPRQHSASTSSTVNGGTQ